MGHDDISSAKIRVYHDDGPDDVMERVDAALRRLGIEIVDADGGDGWQEYEIRKSAHATERVLEAVT